MGLLEPDGRHRHRDGEVPLTLRSSRVGIERSREPVSRDIAPSGPSLDTPSRQGSPERSRGARRLLETNGAEEREVGSTGVLVGIARHAKPGAAMEVLDRVEVTITGGIDGDFRGRVKPGGRGRRQVTIMECSDWQAALDDLDVAIPWQERRVNLLIDGLDLPQMPGRKLRIGADVVLAITMECDPCVRMEQVAPGLMNALIDDWRGGVCTRVMMAGAIAVGDEIRIEEA